MDTQNQDERLDVDLRDVRFRLAAELATCIDDLAGTPLAADERTDRTGMVRDIAIGLDALDRVITRQPVQLGQPATGVAGHMNFDALLGNVWNIVSEAGHSTDAADYVVLSVRAAFDDEMAQKALRNLSVLISTRDKS